jgi:hypothetical protein
MLFKIERNLDYLRKNKLICLKYYIFLNKLFKQKLRNLTKSEFFLIYFNHSLYLTLNINKYASYS